MRKIAKFQCSVYIFLFLFFAILFYFYGIQLVRQLSIWMTDTFNLKHLDVYFLLYLYVESVNKLSIYLSIYQAKVARSVLFHEIEHTSQHTAHKGQIHLHDVGQLCILLIAGYQYKSPFTIYGPL